MWSSSLVFCWSLLFFFLDAGNVLATDDGLNLIRVLGPQGVNLKILQKKAAQQLPPSLVVQDSNAAVKLGIGAANKPAAPFPAYFFVQPVDHFDKSNHHTFRQRYWVNTRHYKPGTNATVIVIDGGETDGVDRLPFLDTGIADILAKATGGVGVVLEHRYYGLSLPVLNLTTDSLRWLNNAQSAEDSANFMRNIKFPGIDENLTAPGTAWIYYGGSYAGARAAHMRVLYPDIVWGAIASSAVTHADILNWEYLDIIRKAAEPKCSANLEGAVQTIDNILSTHPRLGLKRPLKALFGLGDLSHDDDFASLISSPLSSWQAKCWHPDFTSTKFEDFCAALSKPPFGKHLFDLPYGDPLRVIEAPGGLKVDYVVVNYARYIRENYVSLCPDGIPTDECFGTYDDTKFTSTSIGDTWRLWLFQVCTEWGYFTTAPPDPSHPRIISKLIDLGYESKICRQAFPPGKHMTVPHLPNVTVVNALGDFDLARDRLAFIDGDIDPWRPQTPHSDSANDRDDTILRPFKLIRNGVHHYDEWGLSPNIDDEPPEIRKIHIEMIGFVTSWIKDWRKVHGVV